MLAFVHGLTARRVLTADVVQFNGADIFRPRVLMLLTITSNFFWSRWRGFKT
jgi:hypothetical protein